MPYIIMRCSIDPTVGHVNNTAFQPSATFIEYHVDKKDQTECRNMERIMGRLDAGCSLDRDTSPFYIYKMGKPPYFALNILETEGYKVVGTNTISNHLIWTLHRQPQPQA